MDRLSSQENVFSTSLIDSFFQIGTFMMGFATASLSIGIIGLTLGWQVQLDPISVCVVFFGIS